MPSPFISADDSFYMGKCRSCRYSVALDWSDAALGCALHGDAEPSMVHLNWSCREYEYDPGSLG